MVAYNFQARFAPAVESGEKSSTFRVTGKRRHARAGEMLQLYTGMRQKGCRLLRKATCTSARPMVVDAHGFAIDGQRVPRDDANALARRDGFESWGDMIHWVAETHGLPAEGILIEWGEPLQIGGPCGVCRGMGACRSIYGAPCGYCKGTGRKDFTHDLLGRRTWRRGIPKQQRPRTMFVADAGEIDGEMMGQFECSACGHRTDYVRLRSPEHELKGRVCPKCKGGDHHAQH